MMIRRSTLSAVLYATVLGMVAVPALSALPLPAQPLKTGQTQCDQGGGRLGGCPGEPAGQDGASAIGIARSYTDNKDGTITDGRTGLMWEKLSDDDSSHDYTKLYTWYTAFTKIAQLNHVSFAGHSDWRLPNIIELHTLADYGQKSPAIAPVFNTGCTGKCGPVTNCSCTKPFHYWSATTCQPTPGDAWLVSFDAGYVLTDTKRNSYYVRAVRGGL